MDEQKITFRDALQSAPSTQFPFLKLPPEIRNMIYRILLCHNGPIGSVNLVKDHIGLHPKVLRMCHQVLSEARIILYRQNVFRILIHDEMETRADFLALNDRFIAQSVLEAKTRLGTRFQEMRRFEISVLAGMGSNIRRIKAAVRSVTEVLRGLDQLDYLHLKFPVSESYPQSPNLNLSAQSRLTDYLHLYSPPYPFASLHFRSLEGFAALRNVGTVVLDGIDPEYGQYLTKTMTGCSPLDYLPKMYDALKLYAGPFDYCALLLREACDAMEMDDVDRFKHVREDIIAMVTHPMIEAEDHLFDHDARAP